MHVDPKTSLSALAWIAGRLLDIETWWMNVRIDKPQPRDNVPFGGVEVGGSYRTDLRKNLVLFHRSDNMYFPQGKPVFGASKGRWEGKVHIGENAGRQHSIVIAIASSDIQALMEYYDKVHAETQRWVGIRWNTLPIGIRVLDQIEVYGHKPSSEAKK